MFNQMMKVAIQYLPACDIQLYFALAMNMIEVKDILSPKKNKKSIIQKNSNELNYEAYSNYKNKWNKIAGGYDIAHRFRSGKGDLEAGEMFDLNDAHSPIIYEVNSKDKYDSFDDFQQQILSNPLKMCGGKLTYKSQAYENKLELFTDYSKPPQVNGWPINFSPKDVYVSPYLNAEFGKGIVELTNGEKKVVYDFN